MKWRRRKKTRRTQSTANKRTATGSHHRLPGNHHPYKNRAIINFYSASTKVSNTIKPGWTLCYITGKERERGSSMCPGHQWRIQLWADWAPHWPKLRVGRGCAKQSASDTGTIFYWKFEIFNLWPLLRTKMDKKLSASEGFVPRPPFRRSPWSSPMANPGSATAGHVL